MRFHTISAHCVRTISACVLICVSTLAYANSTPSFCINSNTLLLNQNSLQAIASVTQNSITPGDYDVTFSPIPTQLLGLTPGTTVILPPSLERPTGLAGEVVTSDDINGSTLIVRVRPSRLPGDQLITDVQASLAIATPLGNGTGSCVKIDPGTDSNGDGSVDSGTVSGGCKGATGGDFGFAFGLPEGAQINGLISVSPLDMDASAVFSDGDLTGFQFTNQSSISFTGEISAESAITLSNNVYRLGSIPVGTFSLQISPAIGATVNIFADAIVGVCGSMQAGTQTGLTASASTEYGFTFAGNGDTGIVAEPANAEVNISPPELDTDTGANLTLYGGAVLRAELIASVQGVIPLSGAELKVTALGATSVNVSPANDPWWEVTGQPAVFVDVTPQLLLSDYSGYSFDIVNPEPESFFDSNSEFPFNASRDSVNPAERASNNRESGTALRWSRGFMSSIPYDMRDITPTADGGSVVIGRSVVKSTVIRSNFLGERLWQREITGAAKPEAVAETPDGGFLLAGNIGSKIWLVKLTANGNIQWAREFEADNGDFSSVFIASVDAAGATLGGEFVEESPATFRPWAARINDDATIEWANFYGLTGEEELIEDIVGTSDGGVLMVGRTSYTPEGIVILGANAYSIKIKADGSVAWSHVFSGSNYEHLFGAAQASDGSYVMVGQSNGTSLNSNPRGLVIRLPNDPVPPQPMSSLLINTLGASYLPNETFSDILRSVTPQGEGFVFTGVSGLGLNTRAWLARFIERDGVLEMVWSTFFEGDGTEDVQKIIDTGDGLLLAGDSTSFDINGQSNALWVTRVPYEGYINWNSDAQAFTRYTPMVTEFPPGNLADELGTIDEEDLTTQERTVAIDLAFVGEPNFGSVPIAFNQVELAKEPLAFDDTDLDSVNDSLDNCINVANPNQEDVDDDGFGNLCDADFNNDCSINFIDYAYQTTAFLDDDPLADMNGDGIVNFVDLSLFSVLFLQSPGPSALAECD